MDTSATLTLPATAGPPGESYLWEAGRPTAPGRTSLLFCGDFCPGGEAPSPAEWLGASDRPSDSTLAALARSSDFSLVNLECPLGAGDKPPKSGPRLLSDPAWAALLARSGVDAVSLANNHAMDHGARGLAATLSACTGAGLRCVGAGSDLASACSPLRVSAGARTVTILALAEREFGGARVGADGVCPFDPGRAFESFRDARPESDTVVVLVHGGNEYYPLPRPGLRAACRSLVDAGADAVLCAHTHVIGPIEWYAGAPIAYGLGNLYFPKPGQQRPTGWHEGLGVILECGEDGIALGVAPTRFRDGRQGVETLSGGDARALAERLEAMSRTVTDDGALAREWSRFVQANRTDYLTMLLGLTRPERAALRVGIWPWWRLPRRRLAELLNVIRCESHHEALVDLLESEVSET